MFKLRIASWVCTKRVKEPASNRVKGVVLETEGSVRTVEGRGIPRNLRSCDKVVPKSYQREGQPRKTENELTKFGQRGFKTYH